MKLKNLQQSIKAALAWALEPFEGQLHALVGTRFAVVTVKSTAITNADATPLVYNSAAIEKGNERISRAIVAIGNGDSVGSTYRVARVRSSDKVNSILFWAPDIGTTTAGDVGLYDTAAAGGAVVDADFYASAVAFNAGPYNAVDVTYEALAAGGSLANGEKRIWEALSLATDPMKEYDITITLTGAADAAGTMYWQVDFTSGE
jgi:hypothetical protein